MCGTYPRVTGDGKLSAVAIAAAGASALSLTHDNIVADGSGKPIITFDRNLPSVINVVLIRFDWDCILEQFLSAKEYTDAASIAIFSRKPLVIESKGLKSALAGTLDFIEARAAALLARYSNGAPAVTVRTFLQNHLVEPGDIVDITTDFLPDPTTKQMGVTAADTEVLSREVKFAEGCVDLQTQWTGY